MICKHLLQSSSPPLSHLPLGQPVLEGMNGEERRMRLLLRVCNTESKLGITASKLTTVNRVQINNLGDLKEKQSKAPLHFFLLLLLTPLGGNFH